MMSTIATVFLITSLLLGSGGAVVVAAQGSLPDQPLYGVKTWSEQTRYNWTEDSQDRLNLALQLAERRAGEIDAMLDQGKVPPQAVQDHLRTQIDLALQLAVAQPEVEAVRDLNQVQAHLRQMEQTFQQTSSEPVRDQVRSLLQDRLRLCESGLEDPLQLRDHLRQAQPEPDESKGNRPEDKEHQTPGPKATLTITAAGGSPWTTGTPTPGSGYGPGEKHTPEVEKTPAPTKEPGDGNGSPDPQHTPQCSDCAGPQPTQGSGEGGGQPGGNPPPPPQNDGGDDDGSGHPDPGHGDEDGGGNGKEGGGRP